MPDGDLITTVNQYEYNGYLFGARTIAHPGDIDGLMSAPQILSRDLARQDADGNFPGRDNYGPRYITFDLNLDSTAEDIFWDVREFNDAFLMRTAPHDTRPFVFQLDDGDGKKFCWMRPRRADMKFGWDLHLGWGKGSVQLIGHDPRYYSVMEHTPSVPIIAGAVAANLLVVNAGNYSGGPILEIAGPVLNPRIANAADGGRQIRLNVNVPGGVILKVDIRQRQITLGDIVAPAGTIRNDNQWWKLMPGNNMLTINRDDAGAAGNFLVRYRDIWISE